MILNEIILGHLTQLLWASSEAVGCASANIWIPNKPGYVGEGMTSSYTVCHYSPQGNIIGHEKENYKPRRDGEFHFIFYQKRFCSLQFNRSNHPRVFFKGMPELKNRSCVFRLKTFLKITGQKSFGFDFPVITQKLELR